MPSGRSSAPSRSPPCDQREPRRRRRRCARRTTSSIATRRSSSVAPRRFGVASASGRRIGLVTTIGVSGCPARTRSRKARGLLAEHRGRERDAAPAVGAVRDRDHVGVERGELLGRHDLAARRPGVARGSRRRGRSRRPATAGHAPDRPARDPALGDRVAVREPPRLRGRGLDRAAEARGPRARSAACPRAGTRPRASSGARSPSASRSKRAVPGPSRAGTSTASVAGARP